MALPRHELAVHLLPELREQVFHVTTTEAYASMQKTGAILIDPPTAFRRWSYDSHFRNAGCVSLCDLRGIDEAKIRTALDAYYFLNPRHAEADPVFLLLGPEAVESIITYEEALRSGALKKMIVPFIEAGHPGDLSLELIGEAIIVEVSHLSDGPSLWALKK
jgi:hypothetical protein